MQEEKLRRPDFLFEVSWEVCNKIGGIHTVLTSKLYAVDESLRNTHVFIGPDLIKENEANPEFIEDTQIFKSWKNQAADEGLVIRTGRWNIEGKPIVFLVDYTRFFSEKDRIFSEFWEDYRLDSLPGRWDYIEANLFGYAAGRAIRSFVNYHRAFTRNPIAHFHEWMSGAGLLYLRKYSPNVACVFTTHATIIGRCIAGNDMPLYENIASYNPDSISSDFNVRARYSLEKNSALASDCFTTVSDITAKECEHFLGRIPDVITPNGFRVTREANTGRKGRAVMTGVAEALLQVKLSDNVFFAGTSGRYEFKNKGIDLFIKSLGDINRIGGNREIVVFIFVPAGSQGPSRELLHNIQYPDSPIPITNRFITHNLEDHYHDRILQAISENGLSNSEKDSVKVIFVPSYMNGKDGVFNLHYYDLLTDMDLTVFPSYYEPWGYTPLESLAYGVPTVTTTLAGFGVWVKNEIGDSPSVFVIERTDSNIPEVVAKLSEIILEQCSLPDVRIEELKQNTKEVAGRASWNNFIKYYSIAYSSALEKAAERYINHKITEKMEETQPYIVSIPRDSANWHSMIVHRTIPERLRPLDELSRNLWWSWNQEAVNLFKSVNETHWKKSEYNPIMMLDMVSYQEFKDLENNEEFVHKLNHVHDMFTRYMSEKENILKKNRIAYFSMEYGLHSSLKIYSGGLGILAGDYLKEASDKEVNLVGVGLLYKYGYFKQKLSSSGDQVSEYEAQSFDKIPISPVRDDDGNWISVEIAFPGRMLHAKVWRVDIGRTELYLLDTDIENNIDEDRAITHHLYGGDWENRLKQEILLGIGGIRALKKLGIESDVYHCNEGHAAMIGFERIHLLMQKHSLKFYEAREVVRASSLFTTHTPVPAGHDSFDESLLRKYISHYPERFHVSWERIVGLGRMNPADTNEKFSMSCLAVNLSQEVNGVSRLHGKVTREMLEKMFPGYLSEELFIGYVTNGVHYPTWTAPIWKELYNKTFGPDFAKHHYDKSCFRHIQDVHNEIIWNIRNKLKTKLINHIKNWISSQNDINYYSPREIVEIKETLDPAKLTIGFARRFATYKRAHLLFSNLEQLNDIVNNPARPVQFIFAGKAHPADKAGQDLIKKIVEISKYPQFLGKILFLENYDMELAAKMVRGVDIWLNTPTRPLEASGTSGEKAVMNGVMHFSVLDGWWVEGYRSDAGWALPINSVYANNDFQNELDAETIYSIIENEITTLYYKRNAGGIPVQWIARIKNSIEKVASNFTTNRMMNDYEEKYYNKLQKRSQELIADDFKLAREITDWKYKVLKEWESVEVVSVKRPDMEKEPILLGKEYEAEVMISTGLLNPEDIGVEILLAKQSGDIKTIVMQTEFNISSCMTGEATYRIKFVPTASGTFFSAIRIYAKNPDLPHRQDFCLVKWV
ncbi:MAG: alpha-glucan family phosphorylase [Prevotellaceae bacterium]|jgi:phosphorylase/glycogen(starch) synthase|nr:alpha-glucan family phosphorylase [Prevotellaceae bacterium]